GFPCVESNAETGSSEDAVALAASARTLGVEALLADDYRIGVPWLECLKGMGLAPIVFDDFGRLPSYAACKGVVNFTVGAARLAYPGLSECSVLRGPNYFPARRGLAA